jgi:hypothetical protein
MCGHKLVILPLLCPDAQIEVVCELNEPHTRHCGTAGVATVDWRGNLEGPHMFPVGGVPQPCYLTDCVPTITASAELLTLGEALSRLVETVDVLLDRLGNLALPDEHSTGCRQMTEKVTAFCDELEIAADLPFAL